MPDREKIRVLIVEDHEFTRVGLKLSLEQAETLTIVGEAENGVAAIKLAEELKPDVILMDIELPEMDGIEATRQIRQNLPDSRVIMLTSHTSDQEIFAALGAGANGYCLKNTSSKQLVDVIGTVAEGAVWLDPGIANRVLCAYAGGDMPAQSAQPTSRSKSKNGEMSLSPRETEILRLVAAGLSNQQIADRLSIGLETVKTHMRHIMEKLMVSDRTEAAVKAMKHGLV